MSDLDLREQMSKFRAIKKNDTSNAAFGKLPPQNREMEEAVLGAIMLEKDKLSDVLEILPRDECFYVDAHQKVFKSIKELSSIGSEVDIMTVTEQLRRNGDLELAGGAYGVSKLTNTVVTSAHVLSHARVLMEKFIQRELIRISGKILSSSYEDSADVFELLDVAETDLFEISNNYLRNEYMDIGTVMVETLKQIEKAKLENSDITGVPSGYANLDHITAGWQATDLLILAARPSVGKTAFALNLVLNAALHPTKPVACAFFSLEMGNVQIAKRLLSMVTEVDLGKIVKGKLEEHEFVQLTQRMEKLSSAQIFLDDQAGLNIFELRAKCRRLKTKHNIGLVVIDYLQLMQGPSSKNGNREQEISKISRELKGLAKELNVPILALSQLSRAVETRGAGDKGKMPQLSDLRESGAIEQDADMVMFLYRPEYHGIEADEDGNSLKGLTVLNISKHRNGQLGSVNFRSELNIQKFFENDAPSRGYSGGGNFDASAGMPADHSGTDSSLYISDSYQTKSSKLSNKPLRTDDTDEDPPF